MTKPSKHRHAKQASSFWGAVREPPSLLFLFALGVAKHHVCNANLMRNGADFAVYLNTAQEYDCSDSGASPDEAVSWGKIRSDASPVKVVGDATILFPLLVSQTFAKRTSRALPCGPEQNHSNVS